MGRERVRGASGKGRAADELVEDAMTGYLDELAGLRGRLDRRYDDLKSGSVKPIDGDEAVARLREKSRRRRDSSA